MIIPVSSFKDSSVPIQSEDRWHRIVRLRVGRHCPTLQRQVSAQQSFSDGTQEHPEGDVVMFLAAG